MPNNKRGSLFLLLCKNYLLFLLLLLMLTAGIYALWWQRQQDLVGTGDMSQIFDSPYLYLEDYVNLPIQEVLGLDGAIAVATENGSMLYRSNPQSTLALTGGELACIPLYGVDESVESVAFTDDSGERRVLLRWYSYNERGEKEEVRQQLLDVSLRVLASSIPAQRTSYTRRELAYLLGELPESGSLLRYPFVSEAGNARTLLLYQPAWNTDIYLRKLANTDLVWLLLLPAYLGAALGFILWLNRRIRLPLSRLDAAILHQGQGGTARAGACGGPSEIRQIGENFDRLTDRLAASEAQRQRLDSDRQRLIADISHDLKTPITVISGYTQALRDGKIPPAEIPRYLEALNSKAQALTALIGSFHEYSKVEHPQFSLHCEAIELCEALRQYLAVKYDEIELAGFRLEAEIDEGELWAAVDTLQLRRALDNILDNALRHNSPGCCLFVKLTSEQSWACLQIGDDGSGAPTRIGDSIFEPFTRGDLSRSSPGSGLGLAITRRIIQLHGGSIALSPNPPSPWRTLFLLRIPTSLVGEMEVGAVNEDGAMKCAPGGRT